MNFEMKFSPCCPSNILNPFIIKLDQFLVFFPVQELNDIVKNETERHFKSQLIFQIMHQSSVGLLFMSKLTQD